MRAVAYLLSLALVVTAAFTVPLPYEQTVPGTARPVENLVTVGADTDEVNGDLALLTIRRRDASVVDALVAAVREGQQLEPVAERLPEGIDEETMREILASQFANSFTTAVAVAAEEAGYEVDVTTEVVTVQVTPGSPADDRLEVGDTVRSVDGTVVVSSTELLEVLRPMEAGDVVTVTVERDGELLDVEVELDLLDETGRAGLGIIPATLTAPVELPFDIQLDDANIIGPSAGLMIALTVTDLLLEDDLAAGRRVAGTGSIDGTGVVGPIGSIDLKVEAAIDAGSDLVLVPRSQAAVATEAAAGRIEVIGVATLRDAVDVLRETAPTSPDA